MPPIWSPNAWQEFKDEARAVHAAGLRGDALWKRIEQAFVPLYKSADPLHHAQIYEDAMRHLIASGILPASMRP